MNETPIAEETTSKLGRLKDKVRQLPWKDIAITTAIITTVAVVVTHREKLAGTKTFEMISFEVLDDGSAIANIEPIND